MTNDITDEILTAYLDQTLDPDKTAQVRTALDADPDLQARLAALDVPMDALQQGFDAVLRAAPALDLQDNTHAKRPAFGWAAVLVLGAVVGAAMATLLQTERTPDWRLAVADYQVLYVPQTLAMPAPEPDLRQAQLTSVSDTLGRDLGLADDVPTLSFRRAQVLGFEGAPLIQIAYLSDDGQPFALCVTLVDAADTPPQTEILSGLASAHWVSGGMGFMIIGGTDLDHVSGLAADLSTRL